MTTVRRDNFMAAAVLLGIGLGGFIDGIVFHQILQWHNMLSNRVPPLDVVSIKTNMVWDGLFHTLTWLMTMGGLMMLWHSSLRRDPPRDVNRANGRFYGSLAFGWGLFNFVEGVIDHHWLELHHVHPGENEAAWDYASPRGKRS